MEFYFVLECFNSVSRKFKRCLKFQECFKEVSGIFLGCCKKVLSEFPVRIKGVSGSSKWVLTGFEKCLKGVTKTSL